MFGDILLGRPEFALLRADYASAGKGHEESGRMSPEFPNVDDIALLSTLKYGIVSPMKKSLLETNPHLQDASKREKALARNIETSSAVEGIWVKRDAVSGRFISQARDIKVPEKTSKTSR